jgi:hypothetical protein
MGLKLWAPLVRLLVPDTIPPRIRTNIPADCGWVHAQHRFIAHLRRAEVQLQVALQLMDHALRDVVRGAVLIKQDEPLPVSTCTCMRTQMQWPL